MSFTIYSKKSGTFASEALPLTSSLGMMISPSRVIVAISPAVKNTGSASIFFSKAISSFIRFNPETMVSLSFSDGAPGGFSCCLQASATAPRVNPPTTRVFIDFRLSMTVILNVLFFHLIHDVLAGPHGKGQYRPGNVFIRLRNKGTPVYAKKIFTFVCLAVFIQG